MASNSNTSAAEPRVFGPRRRAGNGNSPRLVDAQELWDIDDVAAYLGVTKQTIYSWRTTGYGPAGFRVGKHLRWKAATVTPGLWGSRRRSEPALLHRGSTTGSNVCSCSHQRSGAKATFESPGV